MKIKRGDRVKVIAGKDLGKEGKVLVVDHKKNRLIIENVNMVSKHTKPNRQRQVQGGIVKKEAAIDVSNVMYLHKGKPTRIGYKIETKVVDGKTVSTKVRIARSTGDVID